MARIDSSLYEYAIYIYLFILNSEQSILFQRPDFWCLLRYLSETVTIFCFPRNIGAVEALAKSQLNILTFVRRASASKQCTDKGKSQRHTGTSQDVRSEAHWLLILIQIGQRPGVGESRGWWWRRRLVNDSFCCRRPLLPRISDDCPATLDGWLCQCDY